MNLIGQPESYNDVLSRIFVATLICSFVCTGVLAINSPSFTALLEAWGVEAEFAGLTNIKALYVFVPLAAAAVSRIFRIHDKISDAFGIRRDFDVEYILIPLAEGTGVSTINRSDFISSRKQLMAQTFYRYASFYNPKIDVQLVRSAADLWAWYWCLLEPIFIVSITGIMLMFLGSWWAVYWCAVAIFTMWWLATLTEPLRQNRARMQVLEILRDPGKRAEISSAFEQTANSSSS